MSLDLLMGRSQKSLLLAKKIGGHFYFVSDRKGANAALIVIDQRKDEDGAKTFRMGRGMLKEFKKDVRQAVYSQGNVLAGNKLTFEITKGNAKAAIMKKAFKKSEKLKNGLGAAFALVKAAQIRASAEETAASDVSVNLDWKANPETVATQTELGLTDLEMVDLLAAESAFNEYESALETKEDEETLLQERQAEAEAKLDEIAENMEQLEEIRVTDPHAARMIEALINDQRIELAKTNPVSGNAFDQGNLAPDDHEFFKAAVSCGVELLLDRMYVVEDELSVLQTELRESTSEAPVTELMARKKELQSELASIQQALIV